MLGSFNHSCPRSSINSFCSTVAASACVCVSPPKSPGCWESQWGAQSLQPRDSHSVSPGAVAPGSCLGPSRTLAQQLWLVSPPLGRHLPAVVQHPDDWRTELPDTSRTRSQPSTAPVQEEIILRVEQHIPAARCSSELLPFPADLPRVAVNYNILGTSLVVQWLRLCTPNIGGPGLIPSQETRSRMLQLRIHMPRLKDLTCGN